MRNPPPGLIAFLDTDRTLNGEISGPLERTLCRHPFRLLGIPSVRAETDQRFEQRENDPGVNREEP